MLHLLQFTRMQLWTLAKALDIQRQEKCIEPFYMGAFDATLSVYWHITHDYGILNTRTHLTRW